MRMISISIIVTMVFLIVLIIGAIALQIFLSKKQNKWLGLILPLICLIFSIVSVLGIVGFSTVQNVSEEFVPVVVSAITVFLYCNIPTVILLGIYLACKEKINRYSAIEKMKIQDL